MRIRRKRHREVAAALEAVLLDAKYAIRGVKRDTGFASAVITTLALGLGASVAMFSLVDDLLLRPPAGVADASTVVRLGFQWRNAATGEVQTGATTTYRTYVVFRESLREQADLAAYSHAGERSLGAGDQARGIHVAAATHTYFTVLGVRPALGRFFSVEEDTPPDGSPVVVISYRFWNAHFGGLPAALGATLEIDAHRYTIIGVAPPDFTGPDPQPVDAWLPVSAMAQLSLGPGWHTDHNVWWLRLVGRLREGTAPSQLAAAATPLDAAEHPDRYLNDDAAAVVTGPLRGTAVIGAQPEQNRANRVSTLMLGVASVVLLIACANVANLLLGRAWRRRREISVRVAMGVGTRRLISQVVTETALFVIAGTVLGLLCAAIAVPLIRNLLLPDMFWRAAVVDLRVLGFSAAIATLTILLAGLVPALYVSRSDAATMLRSGGRTETGRRAPVRRALVMAQSALCVVLLAGAAMFVLSLLNARGAELGFDADRVVAVDLNTWASGLAPARAAQLPEEGREALASQPGVTHTALAISSPFAFRMGLRFRVPGLDSLPSAVDGGPYVAYVSPGYFDVMGIRILRGRPFTDADDGAGERVAVLTATLAGQLFGGRDPLDQCLYIGAAADAPCTRVAGIAADVHFNTVDGPPTMQLFVPLGQTSNPSSRSILVRTDGPAGRHVAAIRQRAQQLDPALPLVRVQVLQQRAEPQVRPWRMGAVLFSLFGGVAVVLAAVGLFSVIAYEVAQRRQEMGIRQALGARAGQLRRLIFGDAVLLAVPGLLIGLIVAVLCAGLLEPLLYRVQPRDPRIFAAVMLMLVAVAVAATAIPAWRASRVNPMDAMRQD